MEMKLALSNDQVRFVLPSRRYKYGFFVVVAVALVVFFKTRNAAPFS